MKKIILFLKALITIKTENTGKVTGCTYDFLTWLKKFFPCLFGKEFLCFIFVFSMLQEPAQADRDRRLAAARILFL